ncbi:hypothetical protein AVEN_269938-1 [Araneus ventricosus]|uniref:Uncharacterized protein n=1 Tax=Araneus ventricosus TaxID=182803 RepID=A0A4Y2QQA4_ARAVE|nr:hypothetical protein AVEN_269938-1 [Araneus ventricosus]
MLVVPAALRAATHDRQDFDTYLVVASAEVKKIFNVSVWQEDCKYNLDSIFMGKNSVFMGKDSVFMGKDSAFMAKDSAFLGKDNVFMGKDSVFMGKDSVFMGTKTVPHRETNYDFSYPGNKVVSKMNDNLG